MINLAGKFDLIRSHTEENLRKTQSYQILEVLLPRCCAFYPSRYCTTVSCERIGDRPVRIRVGLPILSVKHSHTQEQSYARRHRKRRIAERACRFSRYVVRPRGWQHIKQCMSGLRLREYQWLREEIHGAVACSFSFAAQRSILPCTLKLYTRCNAAQSKEYGMNSPV